MFNVTIRLEDGKTHTFRNLSEREAIETANDILIGFNCHWNAAIAAEISPCD